jgi:hypothetical protein
MSSAFPSSADITNLTAYVQNVPTADKSAALRDFAAVPSIELNNCDRTQKKALHCAGPFSYFNATVDIDGAFILGASATY